MKRNIPAADCMLLFSLLYYRSTALKKYCKKHKLKFYEISAVTGKGIDELKYAMAKGVSALREQALQQAEAGDRHSA